MGDDTKAQLQKEAVPRCLARLRESFSLLRLDYLGAFLKEKCLLYYFSSPDVCVIHCDRHSARSWLYRDEEIMSFTQIKILIQLLKWYRFQQN